MLLVSGMRHIQAKDIDACLDELRQLGWRSASRAHGGDDFRAGAANLDRFGRCGGSLVRCCFHGRLAG
jgi:hypothetical protein